MVICLNISLKIFKLVSGVVKVKQDGLCIRLETITKCLVIRFEVAKFKYGLGVVMVKS